MVDLILWRHADAEDWVEGKDDLERSLTARGEKQAARMASWLDRHLPETTRILSSPARRCEQTVLPLGRKYKVKAELVPECTPQILLELAQWQEVRAPVLIVGHQPTLGKTIAQLLSLKQDICPVRKGAVWWIRHRERDGQSQTVVIASLTPDVV